VLAYAALDPIPVTVALPPHLAALASPSVAQDIPLWRGFYPLDHIMVTGLAVPGPPPPPDTRTPTLTLSRTEKGRDQHTKEEESMTKMKLNIKERPVSEGCTRLHLKLDTVTAAWAMLNVTGNLHAWSLALDVATTVVPGQTAPSHMIRYASSVETSVWDFWLDVPAGEGVEIELFVKHLVRTPVVEAAVQEFADWTSAIAVTTWFSMWEFET
jgi:hypothetical protein